MHIKTEKERKYIKKMIEAERIKRKRQGLRRKTQNAVRAAKHGV
ncbi:MAG: hypothetical protein OQK24_05580 [Magnetovibrio sp.]|nr:hypothetical protein [Magnetovibrio sp.]